MKLNKFSVTNYRSITRNSKITLQDFTVLVGKNNEGKSNMENMRLVFLIIFILREDQIIIGNVIFRYTLKIKGVQKNQLLF